MVKRSQHLSRCRSEGEVGLNRWSTSVFTVQSAGIGESAALGFAKFTSICGE
jgi:hypothetical protein